jgi:hypothetical protein
LACPRLRHRSGNSQGQQHPKRFARLLVNALSLEPSPTRRILTTRRTGGTSTSCCASGGNRPSCRRADSRRHNATQIIAKSQQRSTDDFAIVTGATSPQHRPWQILLFGFAVTASAQQIELSAGGELFEKIQSEFAEAYNRKDIAAMAAFFWSGYGAHNTRWCVPRPRCHWARTAMRCWGTGFLNSRQSRPEYGALLAASG